MENKLTDKDLSKTTYKNRNLTECSGKVYECNGQTIGDKFEPKTRAELEQKFDGIEKEFRRIATKYKAQVLSTIENETNYYLEELKELFYNILKRIN